VHADYNETQQRAYAYQHSEQYRQDQEAARTREAPHVNRIFLKILRIFEKQHGVLGQPTLFYSGAFISWATLTTRDNYDCKATGYVSGLLFNCYNNRKPYENFLFVITP
jgi:hypothetical protein